MDFCPATNSIWGQMKLGGLLGKLFAALVWITAPAIVAMNAAIPSASATDAAPGMMSIVIDDWIVQRRR
jgi:hypothetical protein